MKTLYVLVILMTGQPQPQVAVNRAFQYPDLCWAMAQEIMRVDQRLVATCFQYHIGGGIGHA